MLKGEMCETSSWLILFWCVYMPQQRSSGRYGGLFLTMGHRPQPKGLRIQLWLRIW